MAAPPSAPMSAPFSRVVSAPPAHPASNVAPSAKLAIKGDFTNKAAFSEFMFLRLLVLRRNRLKIVYRLG
jgi:hypothetical protein